MIHQVGRPDYNKLNLIYNPVIRGWHFLCDRCGNDTAQYGRWNQGRPIVIALCMRSVHSSGNVGLGKRWNGAKQKEQPCYLQSRLRGIEITIAIREVEGDMGLAVIQHCFIHR